MNRSTNDDLAPSPPLLAGALVTAMGLPAAASVVTEADGQFSRHWKRPTEIGFGSHTVFGTADKQNGDEFIVLTCLPAGEQTLTFDFTAPDWSLTSHSFSAGGQILWQDEPFRHAWDGTSAGSFQLSRWTPTDRIDLSLDEDFTGPLYLGIYLTHGRHVAWSLSAPAMRRKQRPRHRCPRPFRCPAACGWRFWPPRRGGTMWKRWPAAPSLRQSRAEEQGSPTSIELSRPPQPVGREPCPPSRIAAGSNAFGIRRGTLPHQ